MVIDKEKIFLSDGINIIWVGKIFEWDKIKYINKEFLLEIDRLEYSWDDIVWIG